MPSAYVERPTQIDAEQFVVKNNAAFPPAVDDCGAIPGPHLHLGADPTSFLIPVHDSDWIVYAGADGSSVSVMTDADFTAKYVKQTDREMILPATET